MSWMRVMKILPQGSLVRLVQALMVALLLVSCGSTGRNTTREPGEPSPASTPTPTPAPTPAARGSAPESSGQRLSGDMMYDILLGEIAGQREIRPCTMDGQVRVGCDLDPYRLLGQLADDLVELPCRGGNATGLGHLGGVGATNADL